MNTLIAKQISDHKKSSRFINDLSKGILNIDDFSTTPHLDTVETLEFLESIKRFCNSEIDAAGIDAKAEIPLKTVEGLANLGLLGLTTSPNLGGVGASYRLLSQITQIIGGHCASTAVFLNSHHCIGMQGIMAHGTDEQKQTWLPDLASGKKISAFALTEKEAGSDASNVQSTATLCKTTGNYILNGEKQYITNGSIANVLTVIAKMDRPENHPPHKAYLGAFIVTNDDPGFEIVEGRMQKCGIQGTATSKLKFNNLTLAKDRLLGSPGKGLSIALGILDYGRLAFGASCTGLAKACLEHSVLHAKTRKQFGKTLSQFAVIREKIADMAADAFAMESATLHCASLFDSHAARPSIEAAMLKVFSSEQSWSSVYQTMQILGGKSYFKDQPYERWMRDARLNTIGEGSTEVLKSHIATTIFGDLFTETLTQPGSLNTNHSNSPACKGKSFKTPALQKSYLALSAALAQLHQSASNYRRNTHFKNNSLNLQLVNDRLASASILIFVSTCVLCRLESLFADSRDSSLFAKNFYTGVHFLNKSIRSIKDLFNDIDSDQDNISLKAAEYQIDFWN